MDKPANRRRFPRIAAPVYYRPAGPAFLHHRRATVNVSPGGMRVYADQVIPVGTVLDVELLLSNRATARCRVRVAWIERLPDASAAAYDVGLEFTDLAEDDRHRLEAALEES